MSRTMPVAAWDGRSMGGHLGIRVAVEDGDARKARAALRRAARRVEVWASRLTRFSATSELARLNAAVGDSVTVGPTLGAVLAWGAEAECRTAGVVDITLLEARLAAESATTPAPGVRRPAGVDHWSVQHSGRRSTVQRQSGVRFDLDGVAKGWIADRALAMLDAWPAAVVDADGDVAVAATPGTEWYVAIENPLDRNGGPLATLCIRSGGEWRERLGIATSGTTVHRWGDRAGRPLHHLIDPRTGNPAITDVVQATVAAPSAAEAEMLAKAAVIHGSQAGATFLERSNASFGLLVREDGTTIEIPTRELRAAA